MGRKYARGKEHAPKAGAAGCRRVCVWKSRMQRGRCGHLIGERRECANRGDADDADEEVDRHVFHLRVVYSLACSAGLANLSLRSAGENGSAG